jgi:hypothetical protein
MFRRFLDAADYWFGYSDDSSAGSYDLARECCVVIANDPSNAADVAGAGDGEVPPALGTRSRLAVGPSAPPPSPPRGADYNAQLAQARELEAKLAEEYRTVRLLRASMQGKPPRAANARVSWADKPAIALMPTSTSTIRIRPRERAKSSSPPQHCCGPCPPLRCPRRGTCTARRRRSSSKRPSNRPKAQRPASANRGARGMMGVRKAPSPRYTRAARLTAPPTRGARRPGNGSSTRADKPEMATPATSSTPDERAKRRHGRQQAATLDGVDVTTAMRTAHRRRSPREPVCSAGRSAWRPSPVLPPAHDDRQVQQGDGPPCVAQRLPPGVSAGWSHQR